MSGHARKSYKQNVLKYTINAIQYQNVYLNHADSKRKGVRLIVGHMDTFDACCSCSILIVFFVIRLV